MSSADDPLCGNYGNLNLEDLRSKFSGGRTWTKIEFLDEQMKDREVLLRGRVDAIRGAFESSFVVVREHGYRVQCVVKVEYTRVSPAMVEFASSLTRESMVLVEGVVSTTPEPIKGTSQAVEVQVRRIYCIQLVRPDLPFTVEDASRSELEIEELLKDARIDGIRQIVSSLPSDIEGMAESFGELERSVQPQEKNVRVNQDARLNHTILDLRTLAKQSIFRAKCQVEQEFRRFLMAENFLGIYSRSMISGCIDGIEAVAELLDMGQPTFLAQAPQFFMQFALSCANGRVFEIGPVRRAERSSTGWTLKKFTGLYVEMELNEQYTEVLDIVDRLFVALFHHLNENCKKYLENINKQYPFEPLKYLTTTLRLSFDEGMEMLKASGVEVNPFGNLSMEMKHKLGQLVLEKYDTDFYILHQCPLAVSPFYAMPCEDNIQYSNSFYVFMRGEEIVSDGGQRVHDVDLLSQRVQECGIDLNSSSTCLDFLRKNPVAPHCGFGFGLEQFIKLFYNLPDIKMATLFSRDTGV